MDQTFFVFLILFAIIIIYLFKQKQDHEDLKEELTQYVNQENFENQELESNNEVNEIVLENTPPIEEEPSDNNHINLNPEPMNKPIAPVGNGYSSELSYDHPTKINGCDVSNIAPMDYYKKVNQNLNSQFNDKVMNGNAFGEVTGYTDESEDGYHFVE